MNARKFQVHLYQSHIVDTERDADLIPFGTTMGLIDIAALVGSLRTYGLTLIGGGPDTDHACWESANMGPPDSDDTPEEWTYLLSIGLEKGDETLLTEEEFRLMGADDDELRWASTDVADDIAALLGIPVEVVRAGFHTIHTAFKYADEPTLVIPSKTVLS